MIKNNDFCKKLCFLIFLILLEDKDKDIIIFCFFFFNFFCKLKNLGFKL